MTPAQRVYLQAIDTIDAESRRAATAEQVRIEVHGARRMTLGPTTKALNTLVRSGHADSRYDEEAGTNLFWLTEKGDRTLKRLP